MKNTIKISAILLFLFVCSIGSAQWDINGNYISPGDKFGSINSNDVDFITDNAIRLTLKANGFLGLGTNEPSAWQEIKYCPPVNQSQSGLIVTMNKCNGNITQLLEYNPDKIGEGMIAYNYEGNAPDPGSPVFNVPFNFLTGHSTNLLKPLYSNESPIFWVRQQKIPGFIPSSSTVDEFDTKFIVMPDGSCGINVVNPRAALDVRGSQAFNRPSAIFGSRALGTGSSTNGLYQYYMQQVQFVPNLKENGYNQIVKNGDQGMFFSDGKGIEGSNSIGAFVLAPWAEDGASFVGGMRMDGNGNTEFHGNIRATEIKINAQWWSDFVFEDDYKLLSLSEVETFINKNKHLPDVPSEAEVLEKGIDVGDMQAIQQQKIEELTLYMIQLKKEIDSLKTELVSQKSSIH